MSGPGGSTTPLRFPAHSAFSRTGILEVMCTDLTSTLGIDGPTTSSCCTTHFHLMITLGTLFIILMAYASFQNWRGRLESCTGLHWVLMLAFPFPYLANTLGWMTAELGRQPWLIYGLFRTRDGYSKVVSSGDTIFTLMGFTGLYFVLGLLFLYLVGRQIGHGPDQEVDANRQDDLSSH